MKVCLNLTFDDCQQYREETIQMPNRQDISDYRGSLVELKNAMGKLFDGVDRKRSLRASEKAMTKAHYMRRIKALEYAIELIEADIKIRDAKTKLDSTVKL